MLKLGVYRLDQLKAHKNYEHLGLFGGKKHISIGLYDQVQDQPDAERLAECVLHSFTNDQGAYKRTYKNRFEAFDEAASGIVRQQFPETTPLRLHDVGVSDGRTALDFFRRLSPGYAELAYFASDYDPKVTVISIGRRRAAVSSNGRLLEVVMPPFVFNMIKPEDPIHYPLNVPFRLWAKHVVGPKLVRAYTACQDLGREISLFAPEVEDQARKNLGLHLLSYDVLTPSPFTEPLQVVRAMNVLNTTYFSRDELLRAITHALRSLAEGGLFIVGSNQEHGTTVDGAVYRKAGSRPELVYRSGEGTVLAPLVERAWGL